MIDLDKWQEIFSSISRHKMRTMLTALGVFWGIFMLVLLLGAGRGLENGVRYQFRDTALNSLWIRTGTTSLPYNGLPIGRRIEFENADYDFLREHFQEVEYISGRFYLPGDQLAQYKGKTLAYPVRSVHPGHLEVEKTEVISGRYINDKDIEERRKVAVIGRTVVKDLFGDENPVGKELMIDKASYTVVGTFYDSGGEYEMRVIYIPISTAQQRYGGSEKIHQLMVTTGSLPLEGMKKLEQEIRYVFAARKQYAPDDNQAIWISNIAEEYQEFENLFAFINAFVWMVGIGSIVAGVIGVSNIMLILVKDRTKEIGVRKAMGATPGSIIMMIIQESLLITGVAGYLGMAAGIGLLFLLGSMETEYFRHPEVNLSIILSSVLVLMVTGTVAGLMPALKAASINPVEAMR